MYWFQPARRRRRRSTPDRHPIYIHEDADGTQVYGFPAIDGPDGGVKVAFFRQGAACTPETIDRDGAPRGGRRCMAAHLRRVLPDAARAGASPRRPACTPPRPTSTSSSRGIREHDAVTVACGFSGHGFKFVPVVGEILADLATDGDDAAPDRPVRPAPAGSGGHPMTTTDVTPDGAVERSAGQPAHHSARPVLHRPGVFAAGAEPGCSRRCGAAPSAAPTWPTRGSFRTGPGGPGERAGGPGPGR